MLLRTMDPLAVRLHWSHSILQERDFLNEWQAQIHASTLAAELGYEEKLVIDVFALPLRRGRSSGKVTFDDEVVIRMGLADDSLFSQVSMNHVTLSSWEEKPWAVRAKPKIFEVQEQEEADHTFFMARSVQGGKFLQMGPHRLKLLHHRRHP